MQFALDALFQDEIFVFGVWGGLDIPEAPATGGNTGEQAGQIFLLLGREAGAGKRFGEGGAHLNKRRADNVSRFST